MIQKVLNSYKITTIVQGEIYMSIPYLQIEGSTAGLEKKIKQNLKFKTGNFVWRVRFSTELDPTTINNINLYVTSLNQSPLKTKIHYDTIHNYVEIEPIQPYAQNESYILNITKNVTSKKGKHLNEHLKIQFKI